MATLKKTENLFSIPTIAKMQVKSIAEFSKGAFCNTVDIH